MSGWQPSPPECIASNHAIFEEEHEQRLLETDRGRVALMRGGKIVEVFDDTSSATNAGYERFGLGEFSTHPIGHSPIDLGSIGLFLPRAAS